MEIERIVYYLLIVIELLNWLLSFILSFLFVFNFCLYLVVYVLFVSGLLVNKLFLLFEELFFFWIVVCCCVFLIFILGMKFILELFELKFIFDFEVEDILIFW